MWIGVFNGLAILKFSGSPIKNGEIIQNRIKNINITTIEGRSFLEKKGWKFIISILLFLPIGLLDPVECSKTKCNITKAVKIIGIMKCKEKKRESVAFSIEKPPQSHSTIVFPIYGIADSKLVITVAPQNDICPHGSTYPKNADPIKIKIIDAPDIHVFFSLKDELNNLRLMCTKIAIKKILAMFMCTNRISYPKFLFRVMSMTDSNAFLMSEL